jgi:predicted nucleic acid-binding protein
VSLVVLDAGVLFEVVAGTPMAEPIRRRIAGTEQVAPHLIDAEVLSVVQRWARTGELDRTAAAQALDDLRDWAGERFAHRSLLRRAWELRENVRGYDAFYVALAEALGVPLLTRDARLARAPGPQCPIEVM